MKVFFDTSVLVPAVLLEIMSTMAPARRDSFEFDQSTGCCGAHSLAEVYSTLTRMPGKRRISG